MTIGLGLENVRTVGSVKLKATLVWNTPLVKTRNVAAIVPPFVPVAVKLKVWKADAPLAVNTP